MPTQRCERREWRSLPARVREREQERERAHTHGGGGRERGEKSPHTWRRERERERERKSAHTQGREGTRALEHFGSSLYVFFFHLGLPDANWA